MTQMGRVLDIPRFAGGIEDIITSVIAWVDQVERRKWSNEELDETYGRRSAVQILEEGHMCYMSPCVDLNLLAYQALRAQGLDPVLIVQELIDEERPFNCLHLANELTYKGQEYFLDFMSMNRVWLRKGEFHNHKAGVNSLQIYRVTEDIDPDSILFDVLLGSFTPLGFKSEPVVAKLKKDNTLRTYERYLKALGNKTSLYLNVDV